MSNKPQYRRVLLKCSGEALLGSQQYGIDVETVSRIAKDIGVAHDMGVEVCVVVGGGNIFRGMSGSAKGMDRSSADYMGMLATVMNALAVQNALEKLGYDTRVQSAIPMASVCEPYIRRKAVRHMEKGRIVIFAIADQQDKSGHGNALAAVGGKEIASFCNYAQALRRLRPFARRRARTLRPLASAIRERKP